MRFDLALRLFPLVLCSVFVFLRPAPAVEDPTKAPPKPDAPQIAAASEEGQRAIAGFQIPKETKLTLFAAEPRVANIVCFTIDHRGRFFVCESFRQNKGVTDNRGHDEKWLNDDLAAKTVEDRRAYHLKHLGKKAGEYMQFDDRIRLVEDRDGDGVADHDSVYADHFNDLVEGSGAGILVRGNDTYFTCIPNLWRLSGPNDLGVAASREALHTGYGVRVAFRGHDMHGLIMGPDGKLYYSIGDRGYHVVTKEGQTLANPETGAVFRCNPDGSELEVFATGLRNPQELAFDDYGNLFTGDNNSDSGDRARWVYVVEGGETGWRMAYQYFGDRGPWNREKLWHPYHDGQAAYIVPPIMNLSDGPSGLACYPGTGLGDEYRGQFFLCDFRGGPANSGVRRIAVKPKGAGFEVTEDKEFLWRCLVTDVEFGPDGAMYVSDWVNGWNGEGKGRIYRLASTTHGSDPVVLEVQRLLAEGFSQRGNAELAKLLGHADRRVRLEAQLALAAKNARGELTLAADQGENLLARLHGVWGLGQLARSKDAALADASRQTLLALLGDQEPEVRSQAAKVLGDAKHAAAYDKLVSLLKDGNDRVRYFAGISLGKLGREEAAPALVALLAANSDADPILRHAGIMGLVGTKNAETLAALTSNPSPAVRVAAVVALRRLKSPLVAKFLLDAEERVVTEAARAIHDEPIVEALPQLAAIGDGARRNDALARRVLNANFRLGEAANAQAIARAAGRSDVPDAMRIEALKMLADWAAPSSRDRVLGMWRPLAPRSVEIARDALHAALPTVLTGSQAVRVEAAKVAAALGLKEIGPTLRELVRDSSRSGSIRAEALLALVQLKDAETDKLIEVSLTDRDPALRAAARSGVAKLRPADAVALLDQAATGGETIERQQALATLATLDAKAADPVFVRALDELLAGKVAADTRLDLVEAAKKSKSKEVQERVAKYEGQATDAAAKFRDCLTGGDAERGRAVFFEKAAASCVRCHKVAGTGGDVGPELTKIGGTKARDYLLDALVLPSKAIAQGFETAILEMADGRVLTGIVRGETEKELKLVNADGQITTVKKSDIEGRTPGKSAMPEDLTTKLTPFEVRDLVEYLSTRK